MGSVLRAWSVLLCLLTAGTASGPATALVGWPPVCSEAGILTAPNFAGPEDITIDAERGIAYISALDRTVTLRPPAELGPEDLARQSELGGIYRLRLNESASLEKMKIVPEGVYNGNFFPHGVSLLKRDDEMDLLFVISHPVTKDDNLSYVEIFAIDENEAILHRVDSIADPGGIRLNDLVAVGPRQFYASDNFDLNLFMTALGAAGSSKVRYFDGQYYKTVAEGLSFANGMATDGANLFVGESLTNRILTYQINPQDAASLSLLSTLQLSAAVDNLEWDGPEKNALLIGAHPSQFRFLLHSTFPALFAAPSRVIVVPTLALTEGMLMEEVKEFDIAEELLSAASVAASYNGKMLVGAVFDKKALICDLPLQANREGTD